MGTFQFTTSPDTSPASNVSLGIGYFLYAAKMDISRVAPAMLRIVTFDKKALIVFGSLRVHPRQDTGKPNMPTTMSQGVLPSASAGCGFIGKIIRGGVRPPGADQSFASVPPGLVVERSQCSKAEEIVVFMNRRAELAQFQFKQLVFNFNPFNTTPTTEIHRNFEMPEN